MRAIIDIGSNSVLMLVGERTASGAVEVKHDLSTVTRLSEGAAKSGRLKTGAIDRTLVTLHDYVKLAATYGIRPEAVATEGVRMADNRDEFLIPAAEVLGAPVRLLSGDEEARLSYLSVARELEPEEKASLRVLDIGGGSTELIVGNGEEVLQAVSHPIGSVRLTEAFVHHDPPTADEVAAIERSAREHFARQVVAPQPVLHGLAGTVTSCAALLWGQSSYDRERVDGSHWSISAIRELRDRLAGQTEAQRRAQPVLGRGRADVIVAGATILLVALEHCGATTLVVRDRGLRFALL